MEMGTGALGSGIFKAQDPTTRGYTQRFTSEERQYYLELIQPVHEIMPVVVLMTQPQYAYADNLDQMPIVVGVHAALLWKGFQLQVRFVL